METIPFQATQAAEMCLEDSLEDPNHDLQKDSSFLGPQKESDSEVQHANTLPRPVEPEPSKSPSPAVTPKEKIAPSLSSTPNTVEMIMEQKVPPGILCVGSFSTSFL